MSGRSPAQSGSMTFESIAVTATQSLRTVFPGNVRAVRLGGIGQHHRSNPGLLGPTIRRTGKSDRFWWIYLPASEKEGRWTGDGGWKKTVTEFLIWHIKFMSVESGFGEKNRYHSRIPPDEAQVQRDPTRTMERRSSQKGASAKDDALKEGCGIHKYKFCKQPVLIRLWPN